MPRQVYEFSRQKRTFYSTERTGYLTVTELLTDFINDASAQGALKVITTDVIESANVLVQYNNDPLPDVFEGYGALTLANITIKDTTWPPRQRLRKIANPGRGYFIGDILTYQDPGQPSNLVVKVTGINEQTGGVTKFEVLNSGTYDTATSNNKALVFKPKGNRFKPYARNAEVSYLTEHADGTGNVLYFGGNVVSSTGSAGPTVVKPFPVAIGSSSTDNVPGENWFKAYGGGLFIQTVAGGPLETAPGRGGPAQPFSTRLVKTGTPSGSPTDIYRDSAGDPDCKTTQACTRWPVDGIWTPVLATEDPPVIFVGQEIILTRPAYGGATSSIPAGTTIVAVNSFPCVADQKVVSVTSGATTTKTWYEETKDFLWFETSVPITVTKGDEFAVRGDEFAIDDTADIPADKFNVTLEALYRIDPLNDDLGVTGQAIKVAGNSLAVTTLTAPNRTGNNPSPTFYPMLFKGMELTIASGAGTLTGSNVTITNVANVDVYNGTANVWLNINQAAGLITSPTTTVRFKFPFTQPYRVAFQANGSQTLNAFVGTEVQLRDDGHISRVTDYQGYVTDLSGIIGQVPSKVVLDYLREDHLASLGDATADSSWKITGGNFTNNELTMSLAISNRAGVTWTTNYVDINTFVGDWVILNGSGTQTFIPMTEIIKVKTFTVAAGVPTITFLITKNYGATAVALTATNHVFICQRRYRPQYGSTIQVLTGSVSTAPSILTLDDLDSTDPRNPQDADDGRYKVGYAVVGNQIPPETFIKSVTYTPKAGATPAKYDLDLTKDITTAVTLTATDLVHIGPIIDRKTDTNDTSQGFVNRSVRVAQHPESYPLSYMCAFTNRGFFFGIWEGTWSIMQKSRARQLSEKDAWFNWMLVQRPVDRNNGQVLTVGQSPVFCVNGIGYKYWKFIVRERDVMHPTQGDKETKSYYYDVDDHTVAEQTTPFRVPADRHSEDSFLVINSTAQIALTEDSRYLVSFLYNLTTPRFRYSEELDMIGQSAGDVSMASSDVVVTAYGEAGARTYKALSANLPYNAGLRICVIKDVYE